MQQGVDHLLQRLVLTLAPKQHTSLYAERDDTAARHSLRRSVSRAYEVLLDQGGEEPYPSVSELQGGSSGSGARHRLVSHAQAQVRGPPLLTGSAPPVTRSGKLATTRRDAKVVQHGVGNTRGTQIPFARRWRHVTRAVGCRPHDRQPSTRDMTVSRCIIWAGSDATVHLLLSQASSGPHLLQASARLERLAETLYSCTSVADALTDHSGNNSSGSGSGGHSSHEPLPLILTLTEHNAVLRLLIGLQGSGHLSSGLNSNFGQAGVGQSLLGPTTLPVQDSNAIHGTAAVWMGHGGLDDSCVEDGGFDDGDGGSSDSRGSSSSSANDDSSRGVGSGGEDCHLSNGWCLNPCTAGSRMSLFAEVADGRSGSSGVHGSSGGTSFTASLQPHRDGQRLDLPAPAGLLLMLDPKRTTGHLQNAHGHKSSSRDTHRQTHTHKGAADYAHGPHGGLDSELGQVQTGLARLLLPGPLSGGHSQHGKMDSRDVRTRGTGARESGDAQAVRVVALALQGLRSAYELTRSGKVWCSTWRHASQARLLLQAVRMSELRMGLDDRVSDEALRRYSCQRGSSGSSGSSGSGSSGSGSSGSGDSGGRRGGSVDRSDGTGPADVGFTGYASEMDLDPTLAAFVDLTQQMLQQHSFSVQVGTAVLLFS
ncbi:MAG: hypothetical protein WDW38_001984 [Sanguina aurantia]